MGTSHPETKPWVVQKIIASGAQSVLDVGAGAGEWLGALRSGGFEGAVDAMEIWQPYITDYRLLQRYRRVFAMDVREAFPVTFARYSSVIFGDVLEHMAESEAVAVWEMAKEAPTAAIAIPIIEYHQGELNGNPYEVHVEAHWTVERVLDTFTGITDHQAFTVTGAFWRDDTRHR